MDNHPNFPLGPRFPVEKAFLYYILALILITFASMSFIEAINRAMVARAKSEIRNLSLPLEVYYLDFQVYPPGKYYVGFISEQTCLVPNYIHQIPAEVGFKKKALTFNTIKAGWKILGGCWIIATLILFYLSHPTRWFGSAALAGLSFVILIASYLDFNEHSSYVLTVALIPLFVSGWYGLAWVIKNWRLDCNRGEKARALYLPILFISCLTTALISNAVAAHRFKSEDSISYRYATDGKNGWILQSSGPDGDYDLDPSTVFVETATPEIRRILEMETLGKKMESFTYDPTNGTISTGDILRSGP